RTQPPTPPLHDALPIYQIDVGTAGPHGRDGPTPETHRLAVARHRLDGREREGAPVEVHHQIDQPRVSSRTRASRSSSSTHASRRDRKSTRLNSSHGSIS